MHTLISIKRLGTFSESKVTTADISRAANFSGAAIGRYTDTTVISNKGNETVTIKSFTQSWDTVIIISFILTVLHAVVLLISTQGRAN